MSSYDYKLDNVYLNKPKNRARSHSLHNELQNELLRVEANNIYKENCLIGMKRIPSNSLDMVCTDPPYFLDQMDNMWSKEKLDKRLVVGYVHKLPVGMKFDKSQSKKFYEFYLEVSLEIFRILKPGGVFLSFSSPRLYHSMAMAMDDAGFEIRDMLGWVYLQGQVKACSHNHVIERDSSKTEEEKEELKELMKDTKTMQLRPAIEPICMAVKPIEGRLIDNYQKYGTGMMHVNNLTKVGSSKYSPANILTTPPLELPELELPEISNLDKVFQVQKPTIKEKGDYNNHISVKPLSLISHLIRLFTKENAVVLDPFMGSGTTAVACKTTKRQYIGFEINNYYLEICKKRLSDV